MVKSRIIYLTIFLSCIFCFLRISMVFGDDGNIMVLPVSQATASTKNIINNSIFALPEKHDDSQPSDFTLIKPLFWSFGRGETIFDSRFMVSQPDSRGVRSIGIVGGNDRRGRWKTTIPGCEQGEIYRFSADFIRDDRSKSNAYAEVSIWGQSYLLNNHRVVGRFQELSRDVVCPENIEDSDRLFSFSNFYPKATLWMRNPKLIKKEKKSVEIQEPPESSFFPLGVYGAGTEDFPEIREYGLNSVVISLNEPNVIACLAQEMNCTFSVPREPEKLLIKLKELEHLLKQRIFSFYLNDEPGIHSFPTWKAEELQRIIKDRFPESFTNMAIVRPQVIPDYQEAADYFMLDQYPVPNMPMTWLSDSMDEAASYVGRNRLQAVIQAFGGGEFEAGGWPRLPTFEEMNCLAYLAVIHGARGLYFYTYPAIASTDKSLEDFQRVIRRLNSMRSWLIQENEQEPVQIRMISDNRYDPQGNAAVHCVRKLQHNTQMLVCTNTIRTYVEAAISIAPNSNAQWQEYYSGETFYVFENELYNRFDPLEVKVLLEKK